MNVFKSRARYLDIAKGIGISLVVFGHLSNRSQLLRILIYSFHMPLFFIIAGSLYKDVTLKQCWQKGVYKLVCPTYQILVFDILVRILKSILGCRAYPSLLEWINGLLIHGGVLWNVPVWFLMTLFVCRLENCFFNHMSKKITVAFSVCCILICTFNINARLPQWWLTNSIMSFPFFWLGTTKKYCNAFESYKINKNILFIILGLIWMMVAYWNGYTDINIQCNGRNYLLFLFTGVVGTSVIVELSKWIEKLKLSNVLELVGKNSFIILLTHYYVCRGIIPQGMKYLKINTNCGLQIFLTIIIIGIYYCIFEIKQKVLNDRANC